LLGVQRLGREKDQGWFNGIGPNALQEPALHESVNMVFHFEIEDNMTEEIPSEFCNMVSEEKEEESEDYVIITKNAPKELEEGGQNTIDELVEINLGNEENPRPTLSVHPCQMKKRNNSLRSSENMFDCFAWNYHEMPGLDPKVATHKLKIDPEFKPVKQAPRRMR